MICYAGAGQNIPGQNIPCHFLTPRTKHPTKICHPGQNIPCCFCHPGHNIPCRFCHPGHNIPCQFCPGMFCPTFMLRRCNFETSLCCLISRPIMAWADPEDGQGSGPHSMKNHKRLNGSEFKISKILNFSKSNFQTCRMPTNIYNFMFKWSLCLDNLKINQRRYYNLPNSAF